MALSGFLSGLPAGKRGSSPQATTSRYYGKSAKTQMAEIVRKYDQVIRNLEGGTVEGIRLALDPVWDLSQYYVPKRTGALRDSGKIEVWRQGGHVRGQIKYGDARAWYAAIVHEQTWTKHRAPERSKYLQAALEEGMKDFIRVLTKYYGGLLVAGAVGGAAGKTEFMRTKAK